MLLTADLHLTANPDDAYRWRLFDALDEYLQPDEYLFVLGDLTDRRDRHPSLLVNRLIEQLVQIASKQVHVVILLGNHDRTVADAELPYWHFLSRLDGITFVDQPHVLPDFPSLLLLPFTDHPEEDWGTIDFSLYRAAFCHMPLKQVEAHPDLVQAMPPLIYSGDEHTPRTDGRFTYVGAPHPTAFGDDYPCRALLIDDESYSVRKEIKLYPPRKHMIDITSAAELESVRVNIGDTAKVRLTLPVGRIGDWTVEQEKVAAWARLTGITLASVEPVVDMPVAQDAPVGLSDPLDALFAFAEAQNLDAEILRVGIDLLEQGG